MENKSDLKPKKIAEEPKTREVISREIRLFNKKATKEQTRKFTILEKE